MARAWIALGSNLGDREAHLRGAVAALDGASSTRVVARSSVWSTDPVDCPPGSGAFLNAVVEVETSLEPADLVAATRAIEADRGRPAGRERNAPRTVDLDLLLYDDRVVHEPELRVPHPRLAVRAFVLEPLAEIAPERFVPGTGRSVAELIAALPAGVRAGVRRRGRLS